ncbi:tyrosine-type recombinase/integrase [Candidatus Daviesbacteria bacterium]|nr:tyrosine-type recombinase/integrase [Candidatus Daviesbacteria bacterium]
MPNLSDYRTQFIEHLKERSRSSATILAYSKDIEQLVQFLAGEGTVEPAQATTDQLRAFMENFVKQGYSAKSISRKTNSTKTFFKFLKSAGATVQDPAEGLEHPEFENKPPRILTKLEYRALRDSARGDLRMSAIIEVLLQTGVRIGELARINLEDVNLDGENPSLYVRVMEGSSERTVPLNRSAAEAIQKYLEVRPKTQNHALFVTKTGRPLLIRNIRTAIDRYFKMAGISGAKVNDLRHTWVAHHLASGVSLVIVSKLAGHKRISTTERYLTYIPQRSASSKVKLEEL